MNSIWLNSQTNRSVIIALDHGLAGVPDGLEDVRPSVKEIIGAKPDALIVTAGLAKLLMRNVSAFFGTQPMPALFLTCDFRSSTSFPGGTNVGEVYRSIAGVDEAQRLGAVGVKAVLMFGRENLDVHADNVAFVAQCARDCERLGMTMMIEPVLWGTLVPREKQSDPSLVRHIVRLAFELGADVVKAPYTGDVESFREIAKNTPVPIVILGGPKRETEQEVFDDVRNAIHAGAAGVAFGRNVFQNPDPASVVRRLREIVHG